MRIDDFTSKTKKLLAARVGHVCSHPNCRAPTSGPNLRNDKAVSAGDAAHITAASPGGPRYDPSLSNEERRHHNNGIWLCVNHARIIDQDESRYTVELLRVWKADAENEANKRLANPQVRNGVTHTSILTFSKCAKSIITALQTYQENPTPLGIEGYISQMVQTASALGIAAPIEIQTIPYPEGELAPDPFLQNRFEGSCIIRFPDGSEESGKASHVNGLELLVEAKDSAIVALKQWLINFESNLKIGAQNVEQPHTLDLQD
jgi:hypothetical protein